MLMPETNLTLGTSMLASGSANPGVTGEEAHTVSTADANVGGGAFANRGRPSEADPAHDSTASAPARRWRLSVELKALLPVAAVLFNGLLLFILVSLSWNNPQRHAVLVVAAAGAIVVCAVLVAALIVLVHRPMQEIQREVARVGQGDWTASVSFAHRNDEIGELGRNFNRMVGQLRDSQKEIERLHRTQISRAEHFATMGELATGLAHEIRNPLAGIAGVIEIIGRDLPPTSPARLVVKEVKLEILQINRIITDLLECARPKAPEIRLSNLNDTAEHSVMLARQQVLSKPIQIEFTPCLDLPLVDHDSGQVHQVLLNLILNSLQAIDGPGQVRVELGQSDHAATVTVSDNGRGIAAEHLPNIFRPFYTTKGNGTGLGLSLARRIIEDHGGRIEVTSALGAGSKFTVFLPLRRQ
jgi:signal transduction histidine kinase